MIYTCWSVINKYTTVYPVTETQRRELRKAITQAQLLIKDAQHRLDECESVVDLLKKHK